MEKKKELHKKIRIQIVAIIAMLAAGVGLLWAARKVPGFAEWYSSSVYPVLVSVIGQFWGIFPVSIVEIMLYLGIGLLIFWLVRDWKRPLVLIRNYTTAAAFLVFLYAACCGVNYYRVPFSSYYIAELMGAVTAGGGAVNSVGSESVEEEKVTGDGVTEERATKEPEADLKSFCFWLTDRVNEARAELDMSTVHYDNIRQNGVNAMNHLAEQYPVLSGYYPKPKPVLISWILSIQQCSGVYSPFTIEANYNDDMVTYNIPHTICHELSHLRGFMREDEANFIGYLACIDSEDADYRYSGYLMGWIYAGNALAKVDYESYVGLHGLLDRQVVAELEANTEFWDRYEGEVSNVQEKVNDAYLKVNGQAEGVKTYGRVVDLMLIDYAMNRAE